MILCYIYILAAGEWMSGMWWCEWAGEWFSKWKWFTKRGKGEGVFFDWKWVVGVVSAVRAKQGGFRLNAYSDVNGEENGKWFSFLLSNALGRVCLFVGDARKVKHILMQCFGGKFYFIILKIMAKDMQSNFYRTVSSGDNGLILCQNGLTLKE